MADTATTTEQTTLPRYLGAVGIPVRDMKRSVDFYTRVMGMKATQTFKLDNMDETVMAFPSRGSSIVLMQYTDGVERDIGAFAGKLVFYLDDPIAIAKNIRAEGLEIVREPRPVPNFGNAIIGFAKDPDGYLMELLQARAPKAK